MIVRVAMIRLTSLIAGAVVVGACGTAPSPSVDPTRTSDAAATPAASAGWTKIELGDAPATRLAGVVADADGFVIHGNLAATPIVWTSPNGDDWRAEELPGFDVVASEAATSGAATVLFGEGTTSDCAHPSRGFLWLRLRGDPTWAAVPFNPIFCAGGFAELSARPEGFVVAGIGAGDQPFAWASPDGWNWRDGSAGLPFESPPRRLTTSSEGFLLIGRGERSDAMVSADGTAWRRVAAPEVPPPFGPNGVEIWALIDTRLGLFAHFTDEEGVPKSSWRRGIDGSWTRLGMFGLAPGDFVAGGFGINGQPYLVIHRNGQGRLFTSADLETWVEVPIPLVGEVIDMATRQGRTVLLGTVFEPQPEMGLSEFVAYVSEAPSGPSAAP